MSWRSVGLVLTVLSSPVFALILGGPPTTSMASSGTELPELSHDEIRRYSRHLILDDFGMQGQRTLKSTSILCIGSGGLGSPALMYLAAAGMGTIGVVDDDVVDESNLQRQIVHSTQSLGMPKVDSAAQRVEGINPHVNFQKHTLRLDASNALDIIGQYDLVLDGSDNFPTRYLVNDACVILGKPLIYGASASTGLDPSSCACLRPLASTPRDVPPCCSCIHVPLTPRSVASSLPSPKV